MIFSNCFVEANQHDYHPMTHPVDCVLDFFALTLTLSRWAREALP